MRPKLKLYLSTPEIEGVFGEGKWALLKAVQTEGSIQGAAARLGRSYRKAWGDIRRAEAGLGRSLVMTVRGGPGGGRSELTDVARDLLDAWGGFRASVMRSMDEGFTKHILPILKASRSPQEVTSPSREDLLP